MRERNVFRREGDYWTIVFDGKTVRLRDSKGMHYLAALLRRRGERIPSVDLQAAARRGSPGRPRLASSPEQARLAVTKALKTALQRIEAVHPTLAAHLEATIRRGYLCRYFPDPRHPITWEE
jgi:hypothetical protein